MNRQRLKDSSTTHTLVESATPCQPPQEEPLPINEIQKPLVQEDTPVTVDHSPFVVQTQRIQKEVCETPSDIIEEISKDGNLHWGERRGNGWTERWQTQEGVAKRFGSKRGRDVKHRREWQERWEQTESGTRIEKRVTQMDDQDNEIERWVERLDITPDRILETRVGEDRSTNRQWRLIVHHQLDEDGKRHLQSRELEEIWGSGEDKRYERTQLQPGRRVLRTQIVTINELGEELHENQFEDLVTHSRWGDRSWQEGETEVHETWSLNGTTGSREKSEVRTSPKCKKGTVVAFSNETQEHYYEEWGNQTLDSGAHKIWSSKRRWHDTAPEKPWGEYEETVEQNDVHPEEHHEKWWTENGTRFSERWSSKLEPLSDNSGTRLVKYGHNTYGDSATEDWYEIYAYNTESQEAGPLMEKRLEKKSNEQHSLLHDVDGVEHHKVHDKSIGQVDEWHINKATGEKWGAKEGSNQEGITWSERWNERSDEMWLEKAWRREDCEWGELSGRRGDKERWSETWGKDAQSRWRIRNEVDHEGNERTFKDGERWESDRLVDRYTDNYGVTAQGEKWAYKEGYNERDGEWLEKWNESRDRKAAEKRGSNKLGDVWFEAWTENYDPHTGQRTYHSAVKEGENAQGEKWMESWIETDDEKYACKRGQRPDEEWLEEWKDEQDGSKWCKKWASKDNQRWGQSWGDSGDRHWGEEWSNDRVIKSWDYRDTN